MAIVLWFDVGNERYTTSDNMETVNFLLWFDVGNERYTTRKADGGIFQGCGLMQETKDIQRVRLHTGRPECCGLMQETKDIQPCVTL